MQPRLQGRFGVVAAEPFELHEVERLFADAHVAVEAAFFGQVAYLAQVGLAEGVPVEEQCAAVGLQQARDDAQEGRLAGAVAAEEGHGLASVDAEADVGEHLFVAKGFADMIHL